MIRLRSIRTMINSLILSHYHLIIFLSTTVAFTTGFFHLLWIFQNHEFILWLNTVHALFNRHGYLFPLTTAAVILVVLSVIFIFAKGVGPMKYFDDLTRLDRKRRYGDFLFVRLLSGIHRIKERELTGKAVITMDSFLKVHEGIHREIAKFKQDARKLFTPNEMEMSLPVEQVYNIDSELIEKRYQHIRLDGDALMELLES